MIALQVQSCLAVLLYGAYETYHPYIPYLPYYPYGTYAPYSICTICNIIRLTAGLPAAMLIFMKAYLNASEIAKLLRVDRATVSRWLKRGVIKGAIRLDNTRQWRIPLEAYDRLVKSGRQ